MKCFPSASYAFHTHKWHHFLNWDHRRKGTGTTTRTHAQTQAHDSESGEAEEAQGSEAGSASYDTRLQLEDKVNLDCSWCTALSAHGGRTVGIRKTQACTRLVSVGGGLGLLKREPSAAPEAGRTSSGGIFGYVHTPNASVGVSPLSAVLFLWDSFCVGSRSSELVSGLLRSTRRRPQPSLSPQMLLLQQFAVDHDSLPHTPTHHTAPHTPTGHMNRA